MNRELNDSIKSLLDKCKPEADKFNYSSDKLVYNNHEYAVGLCKSEHRINVWSDNGLSSLGEVKTKWPSEDISDVTIQSVASLISLHASGYICCNGCNTLIKTSNVAGRIFAGVYCSDCWNRRYKAEEASINYD